MNRRIRKFSTDRSGATAIEYGLIAGLVSIAIIGTLSVIGDRLDAQYQFIADQVSGALADD